MAKPSLSLIQSIRIAAQKLEASTLYQWGHMGSCNCGFLAQEITKLTREEIHRRAMMKHGDWCEQLADYCPTSGLPMDDMISELISFGFDFDDLKNLERLSDPEVLRAIPNGKGRIHFNIKSDAVTYMKAWANLLEEELIEGVKIPDDLGQKCRMMNVEY